MQGILIQAIDTFCNLIYILILIRILLSWFPMLRGSTVSQFIHNLTEPILGPIRSMLYKSPIGGGMMLDFSPIIALFIMNIIRMVLIYLLQGY